MKQKFHLPCLQSCDLMMSLVSLTVMKVLESESLLRDAMFSKEILSHHELNFQGLGGGGWHFS